MPASISIVIPVLNEADTIRQTLASLRAADVEVIVVDGGSSDETVRFAAGADQVIQGPKGRAVQMNSGAEQARGDVIVFLHGDTQLPGSFLDELQRFRQSNRAWGRFDVRLSGRHLMFRIIEFMMNWRSALTGICTGDQCLFVRRDVFDALEGYALMPLMEDIDMSRRLLGYSKPYRVRKPVITSSRKWEEQGIVRTMLLMWRLRLAYFFGTSPEVLVKRYYS